MKRIIITLHLQEPLLAAARGSDPNTEKSYPFIPGSLLRGAAAGAYLQQEGSSVNGEFTRLFLDGRTRFLNAYPVSEQGHSMLPTPKNWLKEKDPPEARKGQLVDILYKPDQTPEDWPRATKRLPLFFATEGNAIFTAKPEFEIAVHNARDPVAGRATKNEGALFRYQALARGQTFQAEIWGTADDLQKLRGLLQGTLLLGGSHSAGYGLVTANVSEIEDVAINARSIEAGETFTCYLVSDAILRHPRSGQTGADITAAFKSFACEVTICDGKAFTSSAWVGGFNAKWGLPLPQTWATQKGSVWKLKADQTVPAETAALMLTQGIGDRRAEGFGQIFIEPLWLQESDQRLLAGNVEVAGRAAAGDSEAPLSMTPETEELLLHMNERLAKQELDRLLVETALHISSSTQGQLSGSQIGRLRLRIRDAQSKPDADLSGFAGYLAATKDRKSADDQFRKVSIKIATEKGRKNFRDWMRELAGRPPHVWEQIGLAAESNAWSKGSKRQWQRLFLGDAPYELDDELTNLYAARLIEAVCELLSRGDAK